MVPLLEGVVDLEPILGEGRDVGVLGAILDGQDDNCVVERVGREGNDLRLGGVVALAAQIDGVGVL